MGLDFSSSEDGRYEMAERPAWRGLDISLSLQQELACAFRIIARSGCNLDVAGHITWVVDDDGNMWTNPWGLWWEEVKASDMVLVDSEGNHLDGKWPANPAIFIHTELHRRRGDRGRVAVHTHPYYGVLLGTMEVVPQVTDQQACIFYEEIGVYDEYTGGVTDLSEGVSFANGVGDKSVVLLKNHGALITAPNIRQATFKAVTFERTCRLNYDALAAGVKPSVVAEDVQMKVKAPILRYATESFWEGAVRQLIAREPEVLL
jgi:ribulose-5-phosphate 4-epimerase/fuculose-1-phosphate aldolase